MADRKLYVPVADATLADGITDVYDADTFEFLYRLSMPSEDTRTYGAVAYSEDKVHGRIYIGLNPAPTSGFGYIQKILCFDADGTYHSSFDVNTTIIINGIFVVGENEIYYLYAQGNIFTPDETHLVKVNGSGTILNDWTVDASRRCDFGSVVVKDNIAYLVMIETSYSTRLQRYNLDTSTNLTDLFDNGSGLWSLQLNGTDNLVVTYGSVPETGGGGLVVINLVSSTTKTIPFAYTHWASYKKFHCWGGYPKTIPSPGDYITTRYGTSCDPTVTILEADPSIFASIAYVSGPDVEGTCPIPWNGGGVFKLVTDKLNDTYYTSETTTEDLKKPDPFAETYLAGDE